MAHNRLHIECLRSHVDLEPAETNAKDGWWPDFVLWVMTAVKVEESKKIIQKKLINKFSAGQVSQCI